MYHTLMKAKITERLKIIGKGYELDKLPPRLLSAVIDYALPQVEDELKKAEQRALEKIVTEGFVVRAIKTALESKPRKKAGPEPAGHTTTEVANT